MQEDHKKKLKQFLVDLGSDTTLFNAYSDAMKKDDNSQAIEKLLVEKGLDEETINIFKSKDANLVKNHLNTSLGKDTILILIFISAPIE